MVLIACGLSHTGGYARHFQYPFNDSSFIRSAVQFTTYEQLKKVCSVCSQPCWTSDFLMSFVGVH